MGIYKNEWDQWFNLLSTQPSESERIWWCDKKKFLGNDVPKENKHYTCIACITIESVMRMVKKNYPQVYLEEWKKIKKMN